MKKSLTYLLLTLASVFWGVSFILTKELFLTEEHMTVTILIAMRLAMATVVMVPMMALMGKLQPLRRGDLKWFLLLTLCEPFIYHLCETSGVQLVSGSLASVVIATIPLFVPFGVWAAYHRRPPAAVVVGVALSLIGVAIMLFSPENSYPLTANSYPLKGLLFLSGAVVIAVVYTLLLVKVVDRYNPLVITTYQNIIGLIYFLPLVLLFDAPHLAGLSYSPRMFALLLILGICCSTLAYAFYNHGIHRLGAAEACIFNNTIPIFSLAAAVIIGQESFNWTKLIGVLIVIAGVIISQRPPKAKKHLAGAAMLVVMLTLTGCMKPYGPVPTEAQLAWQRMEVNLFCHFGPNTFTGAEWGSGQESEEVFNPQALDCRQWVDVAKQAGMGGIILTAKHHDGFCLWPSQYSTHTVKPENDVLRAFVEACREGGVKPGVYISPWDRNHPAYGTDEYNTVFANTLNEVHTKYGPFFEQWFDGACGEGPNGKKQHYDWPRFMQTMHDLNLQAIIFSDIGPGCRWVGNEEGHCGDPCWSTLNTAGATPSDNKPAPSELETGHKGGTSWVPAEVDVSIRPGWFWHANEHPKTVNELMEIYFNSVGRNGLLLLNVPPDTNGRIPAEDSAVLVAFRAERDRIFARDLAQGAKFRTLETLPYCLSLPGHGRGNVLDSAYHTYWAALNKKAQIDIVLDSFTTFDIIVIQEYIPLGQRIYDVQLAINEGDGMYAQTNLDYPLCTTVGYKRIIRLDEVLGYPVRTDRIILTFRADAPPVINRIALYNSKAQ